MEDVRLKKIAFRAWHRGFREADLILGAFADAQLPSLTLAELDQFELLLEEADHDIYNWIIERTPTPPEFENEIMSKLKLFKYQVGVSSEQPRGA